MSARYAEFRSELIEDHVTLAESEAHAAKLRAEIRSAPIIPGRINLRVAYAEEELRATTDYIREIKRQMALEESEAM